LARRVIHHEMKLNHWPKHEAARCGRRMLRQRAEAGVKTLAKLQTTDDGSRLHCRGGRSFAIAIAIAIALGCGGGRAGGRCLGVVDGA